ncbi:vWA domain-containing protein [Psychroflexus salis]|uniref:BatB protein n=1 Tax=Psychroflexus salis TaxID=1526574 RepID=A0A916ZLH0_9FLAO|nr:VWA domain-containing protein [Psychroflexus salis]GGE03437.1 BatB protein [Psychroflexus salis]
MLILEDKIYFWFLAAIPVVIFIAILVATWKIKMQKKFAEAHLFPALAPDRSKIKPILKLIAFCLVIAFFSVALVNPKLGSKMETVKREGVDIVFALDVSKSMLAEDIAPNRIEKSKQIISQIVNNLKGDRIGIIGYAGSAFPQIPITTDYASAKTFLRAMNTDMVSSQGSATGDAIELAKGYYNDANVISRVLIIVGDGEDHGSEFQAAAQAAADEGIKIVTISVGTSKGGPIPIKNNRGKTYKKDQKGETVITRSSPETLNSIAEIGNGTYIDGTNTSSAIKNLEKFLQNLEKTEYESMQYANYQHQFQWFLGFGILFLILDSLLLNRKTKWLTQLNLFNEA